MAYESKIKDFKKSLEANELRFLTAVGELVKGQAMLLCPAGKFYGGNLRQDIDYKVVESDKFVAIGNNLEYAIYVNKGSGVYAEGGGGRKTAWTYYDPVTEKYYKTVGQEPQPYLEEAIELMTPRVQELAKSLLNGENHG